MNDYEQIVATVERNIATFPERIVPIAARADQAVRALADGERALDGREATAVRALETAFTEAMQAVAWLLHRRGSDEAARTVLASARRVHEASLSALRGRSGQMPDESAEFPGLGSESRPIL